MDRREERYARAVAEYCTRRGRSSDEDVLDLLQCALEALGPAEAAPTFDQLDRLWVQLRRQAGELDGLLQADAVDRLARIAPDPAAADGEETLDELRAQFPTPLGRVRAVLRIMAAGSCRTEIESWVVHLGPGPEPSARCRREFLAAARQLALALSRHPR